MLEIYIKRLKVSSRNNIHELLLYISKAKLISGFVQLDHELLWKNVICIIVTSGKTMKKRKCYIWEYVHAFFIFEPKSLLLFNEMQRMQAFFSFIGINFSQTTKLTSILYKKCTNTISVRFCNGETLTETRNQKLEQSNALYLHKNVQQRLKDPFQYANRGIDAHMDIMSEKNLCLLS